MRRIDGDRAEVLLDVVWQSVTWAKSARGLQAAQEAKGPEVALAASRPSGQSRGRIGDLRIFSPSLYQLSYLSISANGIGRARVRQSRPRTGGRRIQPRIARMAIARDDTDNPERVQICLALLRRRNCKAAARASPIRVVSAIRGSMLRSRREAHAHHAMDGDGVVLAAGAEELQVGQRQRAGAADACHRFKQFLAHRLRGILAAEVELIPRHAAGPGDFGLSRYLVAAASHAPRRDGLGLPQFSALLGEPLIVHHAARNLGAGAENERDGFLGVLQGALHA